MLLIVILNLLIIIFIFYSSCFFDWAWAHLNFAWGPCRFGLNFRPNFNSFFASPFLLFLKPITAQFKAQLVLGPTEMASASYTGPTAQLKLHKTKGLTSGPCPASLVSFPSRQTHQGNRLSSLTPRLHACTDACRLHPAMNHASPAASLAWQRPEHSILAPISLLQGSLMACHDHP